MLIHLQNISKSFGNKGILYNISLLINEKDHIGLVGDNGCGKTTLCKIICGIEEKDSGNIIKKPSLAIEYLPQEITFADDDITIFHYIEESVGQIKSIRNQMIQIEEKMAYDTSEPLLEKYGQLQDIFEKRGGYDFEHKIEKIFQGLKLERLDLNRKISTLSGGEKARVALASVLLTNPDLLILDEPTNHLNFSMLDWLSDYLLSLKSAFLIISHDRELLNKAVEKIIEISSQTHQIDYFPGNYDHYLKENERRYQKKVKQYEDYCDEIKLLKKELKKKTHNTKKGKGPTDSFKAAWNAWGEKSQASLSSQINVIKTKLQRLEENPVLKPEKSILKGGGFFKVGLSADIPIKLKNISMSYGKKMLLNDLSIDIKKNEKIVLTGDNGEGKTTLLEIIAQNIVTQEGQVIVVDSVKMAYMQQNQNLMDLDKTVLEYYGEYKKDVESKLRADLYKYGLFSENEVFLKLKNLSFGQRQKLAFIKLIAEKPNFLLLDEPTNHIDLLSLEAIEAALSHFEGSMIIVSHDRRFIQKIATKVWKLKNGKIL